MDVPGFNWVEARANCSLGNIFQILSEVVDSDVKAMNGLHLTNLTFSLSSEAMRKIVVIRGRRRLETTVEVKVVFELLPDRIKVSQGSELVFFAVPSLSEEGECLLDVDGETLRLWQVSRKALESLFFEYTG